MPLDKRVIADYLKVISDYSDYLETQHSIVRRPELYPLLAISGTDGTIIPAGSRYTDAEKKITYVTLGKVVISNGKAVVNAIATAMKEYRAIPRVHTVHTPINEWKSITNIELLQEGMAEETDDELRRRILLGARTLFKQEASEQGEEK